MNQLQRSDANYEYGDLSGQISAEALRSSYIPDTTYIIYQIEDNTYKISEKPIFSIQEKTFDLWQWAIVSDNLLGSEIQTISQSSVKVDTELSYEKIIEEILKKDFNFSKEIGKRLEYLGTVAKEEEINLSQDSLYAFYMFWQKTSQFSQLKIKPSISLSESGELTCSWKKSKNKEWYINFKNYYNISSYLINPKSINQFDVRQLNSFIESNKSWFEDFFIYYNEKLSR